MSASKTLSLSEVSAHDKPGDCWVVLYGKVYDLTKFALVHPGGDTNITWNGGSDVSEIFRDQGHGRAQILRLSEYYIGELDDTSRAGRIAAKNLEYKQRPNEQCSKTPSKTPILGTTPRSLTSSIKILPSHSGREVTYEEQSDEQFPKRQWSLDEVGQHDHSKDCWVVISGKVYDLTNFAAQHPGGETNLTWHAGTDATQVFREQGHELKHLHVIEDYCIGFLEDAVSSSRRKHPSFRERKLSSQDIANDSGRLSNTSLINTERKSSSMRLKGSKATLSQSNSKSSIDADNDQKFEMTGSRKVAQYNLDDLSKHDKPKDCWIVLFGKVFDVSPFVDHHPGGDTNLTWHAGTDASRVFQDQGHGIKHLQVLEKYFVGVLTDGSTQQHLSTRRRYSSFNRRSSSALSEASHGSAKSLRKHSAASLGLGIVDPPSSSASFFNTASDLRNAKNMYSTEEVAKHDRAGDAWFIVNGKVYDLSQFLGKHPGGEHELLPLAGGDASKAFRDQGHELRHLQIIEQYCVGHYMATSEVAQDRRYSTFSKRRTARALSDSRNLLYSSSRSFGRYDSMRIRRSQSANAQDINCDQDRQTNEDPTKPSVSQFKQRRYFSSADVSAHDEVKDCWITISGKIYDLTDFITLHPGGETNISWHAGTDGTQIFMDQGHSIKHLETLEKYLIGYLDDSTSSKPGRRSLSGSHSLPILPEPKSETSDSRKDETTDSHTNGTQGAKTSSSEQLEMGGAKIPGDPSEQLRLKHSNQSFQSAQSRGSSKGNSLKFSPIVETAPKAGADEEGHEAKHAHKTSSQLTMDEIARHDKPDDCWVVVHGKVYNLTKFADIHPGSASNITWNAGTDATIAFEEQGHSLKHLQFLEDYYVGVLSASNSPRRRPSVSSQVSLPSDARNSRTGEMKSMKQSNSGIQERHLKLVAPSRMTRQKSNASNSSQSMQRGLAPSKQQSPSNSLKESSALITTADQSREKIDIPEALFKEGNLTDLKPNVYQMKNIWSFDQIAKHDHPKDCWVVIDGGVFDLTDFVSIHPGGEANLTWHAGGDASDAFKEQGHGAQQLQTLEKYKIGEVDRAYSTNRRNPSLRETSTINKNQGSQPQEKGKNDNTQQRSFRSKKSSIQTRSHRGSDAELVKECTTKKDVKERRGDVLAREEHANFGKGSQNHKSSENSDQKSKSDDTMKIYDDDDDENNGDDDEDNKTIIPRQQQRRKSNLVNYNRESLSEAKFTPPEVYWTASEVEEHDMDDDCIIIIRGLIYNLSSFAKLHPGGSQHIFFQMGKDATSVFADQGHGERQLRVLRKYCIGRLDQTGNSFGNANSEPNSIDIERDYQKKTGGGGALKESKTRIPTKGGHGEEEQSSSQPKQGNEREGTVGEKRMQTTKQEKSFKIIPSNSRVSPAAPEHLIAQENPSSPPPNKCVLS